MKKENPAKKFEKCLDISDRFDLFFTERASYPFAILFNDEKLRQNSNYAKTWAVVKAFSKANNALTTWNIGFDSGNVGRRKDSC